jgi:hypothetical protein
VNGAVKQNANLNQMTWNVAEQIANLSTFYELFPRDIIYSGTPENVGPVVKGDLMTGPRDGIYDHERESGLTIRPLPASLSLFCGPPGGPAALPRAQRAQDFDAMALAIDEGLRVPRVARPWRSLRAPWRKQARAATNAAQLGAAFEARSPSCATTASPSPARVFRRAADPFRNGHLGRLVGDRAMIAPCVHRARGRGGPPSRAAGRDRARRGRRSRRSREGGRTRRRPGRATGRFATRWPGRGAGRTSSACATRRAAQGAGGDARAGIEQRRAVHSRGKVGEGATSRTCAERTRSPTRAREHSTPRWRR